MNKLLKKIACIGDSLTEGDYGISGKRCIANVHKENYPHFLSQILKVNVLNYGKSGFTSTTYLDWFKLGNVDVKSSDIIIVMLGTNGGISSTSETQGNRDYVELINLICLNAPKAKIVLCTPPHATENPEYSNCGYAPQVKEAVYFTKKIAFEMNFPLIDCASCQDFTVESEHIMQPNDGLHFGKVGYFHLADFIAKSLKNIFPEYFD